MKFILLMLFTLSSYANGYYLEVDGAYGRIVNNTGYELYCEIGGYEIRVRPNSVSRWYRVGSVNDWEC